MTTYPTGTQNRELREAIKRSEELAGEVQMLEMRLRAKGRENAELRAALVAAQQERSAA